jgi:hypothetical protein
MSLELLRSLDPAAEPVQGAVRLRPTVPGGDAIEANFEQVGRRPDAGQGADALASWASAPQHAWPSEAAARDDAPHVAPARGGPVMAVAFEKAAADDAPRAARPGARTGGIGQAGAVLPGAMSTDGPAAVLGADARLDLRGMPAASATGTSASGPATPSSRPAPTFETPRVPLDPARAALLAPTSTARAVTAPAVLHVTIDRIDVRSAAPAAAPPRAGPARSAPSRSLADYLRGSGDSSSSRGGPRS